MPGLSNLGLFWLLTASSNHHHSILSTILDERSPSGPWWLTAALQMLIRLWGNEVYRPWPQEPVERLWP